MPGIRAIEPRLPVADIRRSLAFYRNRLGFEPTGVFPDPDAPEFVILASDGVRLQLDATRGPASPGVSPCTLWIDAVAIDPFLEALEGQAPEWGPEVYDYGRREFGIRDPDGHLLVFSECTDGAAIDHDRGASSPEAT